MMPRRDALGLAAGLLAWGCGRPSTPTVEAPAAAPPLHVEPMVDLVTAAGLTWLIVARPQLLWGDAATAATLRALVPAERFEGFAARHGADIRLARELVVAQFPETLLGLVAMPLDPASVERAFASRALSVDGRSVRDGVTRIWGTVGAAHEEVALFGRSAAALERRPKAPPEQPPQDPQRAGALDVAVYFAKGRLKRSVPALHADPLAAAARRLGDAPLRGFAPGPFEGAWAGGFAGLLRATTALGAALSAGTDAGTLTFRLVLMGAWGADAKAAAERLDACLRVLAEDPLGLLIGLNPNGRGSVRPRGDDSALELTVALDAQALTRGVRAATDASFPQIMDF